MVVDVAFRTTWRRGRTNAEKIRVQLIAISGAELREDRAVFPREVGLRGMDGREGAIEYVVVGTR